MMLFSDGINYKKVNAENVPYALDLNVRTYIFTHGYTDKVDINSNGGFYIYSSLLSAEIHDDLYFLHRLDDQNGQTT